MGAEIETTPDGLVVSGPTPLHAAQIDSYGDHRIAMMAGVAGLLASGETLVSGAECIATSFPEFAHTLAQLGAEVEVR
jgi:3-phosphoshikimate 1-carboxyvinyltransferase